MGIKTNIFCRIDNVEDIDNLKRTLTNVAPELDMGRSMVYISTKDSKVYLEVRNRLPEWLTVNDNVVRSLCTYETKLPPIEPDNGLIFVYNPNGCVVSGEVFKAIAYDTLLRPTAGFITAQSPNLEVSYRYANKERIYSGRIARLSKKPESEYEHNGHLVEIDYPPMGTYITHNSTFLEYNGNLQKLAKGLCLAGYANYLDLEHSFLRR